MRPRVRFHSAAIPAAAPLDACEDPRRLAVVGEKVEVISPNIRKRSNNCLPTRPDFVLWRRLRVYDSLGFGNG
jgi:hypothetical protein